MVSISKPKRTNEIRQREIKEIRRLLNALYTDSEIIDKLKDYISEATYWRYKRSIVKEDKGRLDKLRQEMFDHSMLMANKGLDYIIQINRKICEDPKTSAFNKRESSIVVAKAFMAKAELLDVGPQNNAIRLMPRQIVGSNASLVDSDKTTPEDETKDSKVDDKE
jgi:hypothetical protein